MALLPLAGWAADIRVAAIDFYPTYGSVPTSATADMYTVVSKEGATASDAEILAAITFVRVESGDNVKANGTEGYQFKLQGGTAGSDRVVILGTENTATMFIQPKTLEASWIATIPDQAWTGEEVTPSLTITDPTLDALTVGSDYLVTYEDNVAVGINTAKAKVTGTGNYKTVAAIEKTFSIKTDIATAATATLGTIAPKEYDFGTSVTLESAEEDAIQVKLKSDNTPLTKGTDYTISYLNSTGTGTADVLINGTGSYAGTITLHYTIGKKRLEGGTLTVADKTFTGAPIVHDAATLSVSGHDLTLGTDFEIDATNYANNTNKGTATAAIKAKADGNFTGSLTKTFTISEAGVDGLTAPNAPTIAAVGYNGQVQQPVITWTMADGAYTPTVYNAETNPTGDYSYTISTENPKNQGTYTVTITGHNNLTGSKAINYVINKAEVTVKADPKEYGIGAEPAYTQTTTGTVYSPDVLGTITYKVTANTVTNAADVTSAPEANINAVGTYNIWPVITGANDNYDITIQYGTLTISEGTIAAKVVDQQVTFGENFAAGNIEHYDGLNATQAADFNTNVNKSAITGYKIYKVVDGQEVEATTVTGQTFYPAGTYVVRAQGTASYTGYNVGLNPGTWTVNQKDISYVTIADLSKTYTGTEAAPSTTGKLTFSGMTLVEGTDYTVALKSGTGIDNMNYAATAKGKITITAAEGNYTGYVDKEYQINKADLYITADDFTGEKAWKYGTPEPTYTATVSTEAGKCLVGQDAGKDLTQTQTGFTGTLKVKRVCNNTISTYAEGLVPYDITANNYTIHPVPGKLEIARGTMKLKVKNVENIYGVAFNAATQGDLELVADDADNAKLSETVKNNFKSYLTLTGATYTLAAAEEGDNNKYVVSKNYALSVAGVESTNFDVETIANGTFTVTPRKVTVKVLAQNAGAYDGTDKFNSVATEGTTVNVTSNHTPALDPIYAYTETVADLGITLTCANHTAICSREIDVDKTNANANYDINVVTDENSKLTITGAPLTITRGQNNAATIQNYNGATVNVTVDRNITVTEKWFTMVLPFNATLGELVQKWGYVVVNTLDKTNTDENKVVFNLQMQNITANEPFLIKFSQTVSAPVTFEGKDITYVAEPSVSDAVTGTPNKFIGSYDNLTVAISDKNWVIDTKKDKFVKNTSDSEVKSIYAYLQTAKSLDSFAPAIFVEDIDGTVTAINGIASEAEVLSADGWYTVNGVKLNAAPTQKGIYIKDGKKVVIK